MAGKECISKQELEGRRAADSGRVTKGAWVEGALRRLSVALCKGNDFLFHAPRGRVLWPPMLSHTHAPEPSWAPCRG